MKSMAGFQFRDYTKLTSSWDWLWVDGTSRDLVAARTDPSAATIHTAGIGCERRTQSPI